MKPHIPNNLPPSELDWKSLIPLISQANTELGRYDGMLRGMLNPAILV